MQRGEFVAGIRQSGYWMEEKSSQSHEGHEEEDEGRGIEMTVFDD